MALNKAETAQILTILRVAYPNFYKGISQQDALDTVNLWADMFADEDAALVAAAVKTLIAGDEKGFPPTIGTVKARIRQITMPEKMTDGEAWALVSKAIRNSGYDSKAEFERLPASIQRIVGSPSQLRDWSQMDSDTVHSVVSSNFQRAYRARQEADEREFALPNDVIKLMEAYKAPALEG